MTPSDTLSGGFTDPARQSAHAFRLCLDVLARPGRIATLDLAQSPAPLSVAAGTVALTLLDHTTPVHLAGGLDCAAVRDWLTFHTNAPVVAAADAVFAFGRFEDLIPLESFAIGTPEYPDRAATLVIEVDILDPVGARLTGPGIRDFGCLSLPDTTPFRANHALFPLGFDAFLTCGARIAGLPRSTIVEDF